MRKEKQNLRLVAPLHLFFGLEQSFALDTGVQLSGRPQSQQTTSSAVQELHLLSAWRRRKPDDKVQKSC